MPGGEVGEPKDSRRVVGTKGSPGQSWREQEGPAKDTAEYEPADSRNVTGQAATDGDRSQNAQMHPPQANGEPPERSEAEAPRSQH